MWHGCYFYIGPEGFEKHDPAQQGKQSAQWAVASCAGPNLQECLPWMLDPEGFEKHGPAVGRVSNQPSGLLLRARVPTSRNVYRGCWIRKDSKRAATTAACPLPFYCSTLLSRMRSLSRVLPAFSRNFSSRSSTVILLRSSPFTSNTMRPLSIIRVRLPSSNA